MLVTNSNYLCPILLISIVLYSAKITVKGNNVPVRIIYSRKRPVYPSLSYKTILV